MKSIPLLFLLLLCSPLVWADDGALLQRIVALEERMAELEKKLEPVLEEERIREVVQQQKDRARTRMLMDAEIYSRHDLNLIEKAYQTANEDWTSETALKAVNLLENKYPNANRTGCAVLARAQSTEGNEQLELLHKAIARYGSCYYATGVQVGPYARLFLGMRHKKEGRDEAADRLFKELRTDFPDAVDPHGQLLTDYLKGMEPPADK